MDFLKEEIEKKRKLAEIVKADTGGASNGSRPSKYLRRGEVEKIQEQLESKEKLRLAGLAQSDGLQQRKGPSGSRGLGAPKGAAENKLEEDNDDVIAMADEDVIGRLRARGEPIRLFGESNRERIERLRVLEAMEERTDGQRNDFQSLLEKADRGLTMEMLNKQAGVDEEQEAKRRKQEQELDNIDTSVLTVKLFESDPEKSRELIAVYLNKVMREWSKTLSARSEDEKRSTQGKLQSATQAQTGEYLKPFLKQLKGKSLSDNIIIRVIEICVFMMQREYLKANDSYLKLSIGNAAWPIGVTMVGIHERSAREKIHSNQVAHVLNDEVQRKWIQSIKRLMTFAQSKWPPSDWSKAIG